MQNQFKNLLIGLFLIGAITVFVGLVLFLRPSVGDEKQILYVRFSNINKISVGTRVLFAGKAVGEVTEIDQIYHARETQPSDALGRLYFYQLTLKIDSNIKVYNTDEISLQTSGLLGEKSIAITPRAPPAGIVPQLLSAKAPYYADSIDPIENTFSRLSDIGQKLEDTIDIVHQWLEQNQARLSQAVASFSSAMNQIDCAMQQVNDQQLVAEIKSGATQFTASMAQINDALAQMKRDGVFSNVGSVMANMKSATASIDRISHNLVDGKGTIGKLLSGDDIYLQISAILSKADTMMNDINHYGILFHLNKGWQRVRSQQMNQLAAIHSPTNFRNYFEKEVDQINTAMSRISSLIELAEKQSNTDKILEQPKFKQEFAILMRQVNEMANHLKLYNEQLIEVSKP